MRRALAIALATAGCFSDRGVAIEVDVGGTGMTKVELFVGNAACTADGNTNVDKISCDQLQPFGVDHHLDGTVYFRTDEEPFTADVVGGKARFRLQADHDTVLPIVVAIGSLGGQQRGTATLYDVDVPANDATIVATTLTGAEGITGNSNAGTVELVAAWAEHDAPNRSCVAVEHWAGGNVTREFIVPASDPDCDQHAGTLECDAEAYNSQHAARGTPPTCFVEPTAAASCLLGREGCVDGMGLTNTCDPFAARACMPDRFCECMGARAGEMCELRTNPAFVNIPHLDCTVAVTNLAGELCQAETDAIKLGDHFSDADCDKPVLAGPHLADLASARATHAFGKAELTVSHVGEGCALQIKVSGTHDLTPELGMLEVAGRSGTMIMPVAIHFAPGPCASRTLLCTFNDVASDQLWACAAPR